MPLCLASRQEKSNPMPGDSLISSPALNTTHAVSIHAAPATVWSWLVQIGQDRGGFYSYTLLENLLGCRMKNADRIHPEWQSLTPGQEIPIHPRFRPLTVAEVATGQHLVLTQSLRFQWTWSFQLLPEFSDEQANPGTRLLVRTRLSRPGWLTGLVIYPVMTVGHYLMERKMLLGIKQRSER